jgi:hypothetical protein
MKVQIKSNKDKVQEEKRMKGNLFLKTRTSNKSTLKNKIFMKAIILK